MITEIFEKQDLTRIQARTKVKYLLNFVAHDQPVTDTCVGDASR